MLTGQETMRERERDHEGERQREQISLKDYTYSKISGKRSEIKGLKTETHSPSHGKTA